MKQKITIGERFNLIKTAFGFKQASNNQSFFTMARRFIPIYGEPPRRSSQDWLKLYHKSPRLAPVHQIASDVACSTYGIYDKRESKKIKLRDMAIEKLFKKPNSDITITQYSLFYITAVYLLLPPGEAFWIKERNGLGKVTEVWPVPPHWVGEIPSATRPYFTIYPLGNMQSGVIKVLKEDMVFFKKPDIENPYLRGIGRADGISDELETDEWMSKWQKRFFFNDAVPPLVAQMPGADEPTINRAEEMWQQKFGGYNNAHKVAFLNWEAKFEHLRDSAKEMDFVNARQFLADASRQFFSMPPELSGDIKNSNRSTIDSAYYLYTKNVLRKELAFLTDVINLQLVPEFSNDIYFEFDNVVPEDEEFELKKASEGLKNGGITVDEWRRANGWEELPDGKGQILYVPLNMIPVPLSDNAMTVNMEPQQTELPLPPEPPEKGAKNKALTPETKARMWHTLDKAAVKNERLFVSALKKYFQSQQDKINQALEKSVKQATDEPEELLDWKAEDTLLLGVLTPLWLASLKEGFDTVNVLFSFGLTDDFLQPKFLQWIEAFGAEMVTNVNSTTKDKLRTTLSEGIAGGESVPKLRDRVSQVMTEAKTSRAVKIARTETHNTVGAGGFETYKAANVAQKEWLTTLDGRERDSHAALDGQVVGIDQSFSNGLQYPGDASGPASEVVNCRCTILPVLPE